MTRFESYKKIKRPANQNEENDFLLLVAFLLNRGHQNVWDYGYSFFKVCLDALEKERKMQVLSFVQAIGLAIGGKEKDVKELLK